MRSRSIKPGFFDNEELAEGGPCAQILFEGLWCLADREGILENRPLRIKAKIFPYYDPKEFGGMDVNELLNFLAARNFIRFYSVDGLNLIQIVNFKKHQNPHPHEAKSTLPLPPPETQLQKIECHSNVMTSHDMSGECNADSWYLTPDSNNLVQPYGCVAEPAAPDGDSPQPGLQEPVEDGRGKSGGNGTASTQPKFGPAHLVELWNGLDCRPLVSELTDERRRKAGLRLRKRGDPDWWEQLFGKVKTLNKPWLTFDFLMRNDTNCLKVLEGNYDHDFENRNNGRRTKPGPERQRPPRGYDQRKDLCVIEIPDSD